MKSNNMILESLQERREINELFSDHDDVCSVLNEEVEYETLLNFEDLESLKIDEAKAVTFNGKPFPNDGWAVVMAGGAGSGKGFTINRQVLIDGRTLDVDAMKQLVAKISSKNDPKSSIAQLTGGREYNFKNSKDVSDLHHIVGTELRLDKKQLSALVNVIKQSGGKYKPNLIFDITGKSSTKLMSIADTTKRLGYKNALVWVVTNRQVALVRNLLRSRVVGEELFHQIHNAVNTTLLDFVKSNDAKSYDEAWVIFSEGDELTDFKDEEAKRLFRDSVHKLEKSGNSFILPKDLAEKIIKFLGPQEATPANPTTYQNYKEIEKAIDPYMKPVVNKKTGEYELDKKGQVKIAMQGHKDLKLTRDVVKEAVKFNNDSEVYFVSYEIFKKSENEWVKEFMFKIDGVFYKIKNYPTYIPNVSTIGSYIGSKTKKPTGLIQNYEESLVTRF